MPTEWALRPVSRAWRVGEQMAVVWNRVYRRPFSASRSKVGVRHGPPNALFDLVITTREKSTFYHAKLVETFYMPVEEIRVNMPQSGQQWTLLLWKPLPR